MSTSCKDSRRNDQGLTLLGVVVLLTTLTPHSTCARVLFSSSTSTMYVFWIALLFPFLSASELVPGVLPASFVEPEKHPPLWQVHAYNNNTYILRQSGLTDYEKPFLYLLFGDERAYLFDTGSLYVSQFMMENGRGVDG